MARFLTEHTSELSQRQLKDSKFSSLDTGTLTTDVISPVIGAISADSSSSQKIVANGSKAVSLENAEGADMDSYDLSRLIGGKSLSGEAIVNSSLSWLFIHVFSHSFVSLDDLNHLPCGRRSLLP